ncbi:MAG: hypothetical protein ACLQNG_01875 [Acidimicrobiales bacterium]|jgi:hypothetical protein
MRTVAVSDVNDLAGGQCPGGSRHAAVVAASETLTVIEEPLEVKSELRRILTTEPAAARSAAPRMLASHALESWAEELEARAVSPAVVTHAFETSRREIWLWLAGDRRWEQLAGHLGARVLRRAATPTAPVPKGSVGVL